MSKWAAIDIGSNTVQLLIAESEGKRFRPILFKLHTTRLGNSATFGLLPPEGIAATLAVLKEYRAITDAHGVSKTRVVATSAVRDAINPQELLSAALEETGWSIEILSGREEARISFLGATADLADAEAGSPLLLIDIGGSSSELARLIGGSLKSVSANVGAVRATANGWDAQEIRQRLEEVIKPRSEDRAALAIGAGGTITTAAGLLLGCTEYNRRAIEGYQLTLAGVRQLLKALQPLSAGERCAFSPLLKQRGEIICAGLEIAEAFFTLLNLPYMLVSGGGVPDGCLLDWANRQN